MKNLSNVMKIVPFVCETKNNGAPTLFSAYLDTAGFEHVTWIITVGTTDCTVDCKIVEGDTTSPATDITNAALTQITALQDNTVSVIEIDKQVGTRKRYQAPVVAISNATGAAVSVIAILSKPSAAPSTLAEKGLLQQVVI